MDTFEERLDICIEALRAGRLTLAQCLELYPEDAPRLQPLLLTVVEVSNALYAAPDARFARAARERFLLATGQRLLEAFEEAQPTYGLLEGARRRFLDAARQMLPAPRAAARPLAHPFWARLPSPALAGALTLILALFTFAGYTFATSGDALPGDWNYPVKRATERARLAVAFDDDTRQDLEIAFAEERLEEIERLARRDGRVTEGALRSLQHQTDRLRRHLPSFTSPGARARLINLTQRQAAVLETVEDRVEPTARDEFAAVQQIAEEIRTEAAQTLASPTPEPSPTPASGAADETPDATASASPPATETAEGVEPVPTATPTAEPRPQPVASALARGPSADTTAGVAWEWLVTERFAFLVPAFQSGWVLGDVSFDDDVAPIPRVIRLTRIDGQSIVAIVPSTADVLWYHYSGGAWREYILRQTADGTTVVADLGALERRYPDAGPIVAHIVRSIELIPEPAPTATPTPAAVDTPTASTP